jgi:hypothetical protein
LSFWFRVHISPSLFDCTTIVWDCSAVQCRDRHSL